METPENKTTNIKVPNKNIEVLKKHFGQCFDKNGEFNLEKFKKELAENEVDFYKESYGLDWLGKSYARLLASDEATTLLKEDEAHNQKTENKNSQNLLIKGDNLEVLKHLSNAYYEQVKMIYIDPPYNTGGDGFVYQDNRKFTVSELRQLAGVDEETAKRILDFTRSESNSHSAWLTFMYPRLYVAKQLLKDEGVIFVSIDDNEEAQLRILLDEVFGEENFVGVLAIENNPKGRKNSAYISVSNDFVLIYSKLKDKSYFVENIPKNKNDLTFDDKSGKYIHNSGKRVLVGESSNEFVENFKSNKHYSVYWNEDKDEVRIKKENDLDEIDNELTDQGYKRYISAKSNKFLECTYSSEKLRELHKNKALDFKEDRIFEKNFSTVIRMKSIIRNLEYESVFGDKVVNFKLDVKTTSAGTYLKDLFNTDKPVFPMSKNTGLIDVLATLFEEKNMLILDFFAGSGTTGDAVMRLNAKYRNGIRYILIQLPELLDCKKDKAAYDFVKNELKIEEPTIFEITKERLIRAAKKVKEENKEAKDLDLGFKVFETTPIWDDYELEADQLNNQVKLFDENKLSDDDLQTLLTTWKTNDGVALTEPPKSIDLGGYNGFYCKENLYLLHKGFSTDNLKKLLEKIDTDEAFNPTSIIAFGYHFVSKHLRQIAENIKTYANKKNIDIDFITRY